LKKLELFAPMAAAATPVRQVLNAKYGKTIERRVIEEYGIHYQTMVETVRARIPERVERLTGNVMDIGLSEDMQKVSLTDGREIKARLVVLASGFNDALRSKAGISRKLLTANHSLTIAFDLKPRPQETFELPSLTYYGDRTADAIDYISIFPLGEQMRANLFTYRDPRDNWVRDFRRDPQGSIYGALPGLRKFLPDFEVTGPIQSRSLDLYTVENHVRAGIVLIGDASQTSCPALGTGLSHLLTDIERLHSVYLRDWLASPGMGAQKIAQFYADEVKRATDANAMHGANYRRAASTQSSWGWELHRRQVYWRGRLRGFVQKINPFDPVRLSQAASQS